MLNFFTFVFSIILKHWQMDINIYNDVFSIKSIHRPRCSTSSIVSGSTTPLISGNIVTSALYSTDITPETNVILSWWVWISLMCHFREYLKNIVAERLKTYHKAREAAPAKCWPVCRAEMALQLLRSQRQMNTPTHLDFWERNSKSNHKKVRQSQFTKSWSLSTN